MFQHLISDPFSQRNILEKSHIVKNGRPSSVLPNLKTKHKGKIENIGLIIHTFKESQFENTH